MELKVVLVTSGQPSANPRLVKEAVAYSGAGYKVTVVYCPLSPWADLHDQELFKKNTSINWVRAGYHATEHKLLHLYARLRQKLYEYLYRAGIRTVFTAVRSMALFTQELVSTAKRIEGDVYAGHNLGALPAVIAGSHEHRVPAVFDFEDFHRGEDQEGSMQWIKAKMIEDAYSPHLIYATAASPLISETYARLYPYLNINTINNCFPRRYAQVKNPSIEGYGLSLFWFSQFVGEKRGLETIIEAIGLTQNVNMTLTLLGNCTDAKKSYFIALARENGLQEKQLQFLPAVAEKEISSIAANYDLGLACEVPHVLNREICLTNKIFLYLIAGNAILFSNTKAQSLFYQEHPSIGSLYQYNDAKQLADILHQYMQNPHLLSKQKASSLQLGTELFNWELEQKQLLELISSL
jgi:glycosyltransferase involved in cell wall biosynthesis